MGRTACTEPQCLYKRALYFTLAFSVQLRKKDGKPSVRVAEECQLARLRYINIQYEYIDITIKIHKLQY